MTILEFSVMFAIAAIPAVLFWNAITQKDDCIRKHIGKVHHESYTSFMYVNKTMIPIFHPEHDDDDWICDERKPK